MFKIDSKNILRGVVIGLGIALAIIALGIVGIKVAGQNNAKITGDSSVLYGEGEIRYIIDTGNGQKFTAQNRVLGKEDKTVFDVLKIMSLESKFDLKYNNNYSFGVFIESIAGIKNGDDGKYWQYYVNDKLGEVAADKKEVKSGDKVEWRFEKVPEF